MDFEKYIKQFEKSFQIDLETSIGQNMQMFCPYCGEELLSESVFCPYCGEELVEEKSSEENKKNIEELKPNYRSLYKLPFFEGLEEETKMKIRTFEHVYQKAYEEETNRPLVDAFSPKMSVGDFSPLVMSLSSALEIELDKSVLSLMRNIYGKGYVFEEQELKVELSKQGTLRGYQFCIFHDLKKKKELPKQGLDNAWECAKSLNVIIQKRNKSGHKGVIDQGSFYEFYDAIYDFFNQYMGNLIKVKTNCKKKAVSSPFISTFSFNNEKEIVSAAEQNTEFVPVYKKGILFTDTLKLAHKLFDSETFTYNGMLLSTQQVVEKILNEYIQHMSEVGIVYNLLDVSRYTNVESGKWQSYARCLDNYRDKTYTQAYKEKMGLFIVGGNDVIPMPQIVNPFFVEGLDDGNNRAMTGVSEKGELLSDRTLDTDMLYAYSNQYSCILNSREEVDYDVLLKYEPKFWVGRLPLEEGVVSPLNPAKYSFDEFCSYFERSYTSYVENALNNGSLGINIKKHVTTTCESTRIAVERILEGIPFTEKVIYDGTIQNKKYISPSLNLSIHNEQQVSYINAIEEADMLTFLLHGSNLPSNYCYYGQNKEMTAGGYIAFDPNLLLSSNAKIISGVCCWGARFIGYPKIQSALLTAMYSSTLLFVGSSRTAIGVFDNVLSNVPNTDIAFSELLLKYYLNYLLQGYDAGESLGRAKMDYLQTEKLSRLDALATILEFNLFGDPLLSVQPVLEEKPIALKANRSITSISNSSYRNYLQVYDSQKKESHSILDRVRGLVDQRLLEVRQKVTEQLYRDYKINPQSLSAIHSFQSQGGEQGYRFCFHEKNEFYYNNRIVDTDKNGNITCVIGFF